MPFIVSWPGKIKSSRISDALIDFSDIFPTSLDLAGVDSKKEWLVGGELLKIDGYSFKDVLLKGTFIKWPKSRRIISFNICLGKASETIT